MPEPPDTRNRLLAVQDDCRRDLAAEFEVTETRPQGLILPNVEVRSETFEEVLPELLAASQKTRLADLRTAVGKLTEVTDKLLDATSDGTKSAERLYTLSKPLLTAALATFGVALATLVVAVLQVVR